LDFGKTFERRFYAAFVIAYHTIDADADIILAHIKAGYLLCILSRRAVVPIYNHPFLVSFPHSISKIAQYDRNQTG
jgi:hypothetical protein